MSVQTQPKTQTLSPSLRAAVGLTVAINLIVGLAFLFGPELGLTLWPTPISPVLMRFIGAFMIAQRGIWENARVLFTVALVYGVVVLVALLCHLILKGAPPLFWGYVVLDAVFLVPIIAIIWQHERMGR